MRLFAAPTLLPDLTEIHPSRGCGHRSRSRPSERPVTIQVAPYISGARAFDLDTKQEPVFYDSDVLVTYLLTHLLSYSRGLLAL